MITTSQKVTILAKQGLEVPPFPKRRLPIQERYLLPNAWVPQEELDADADQREAVIAWERAVDHRYVLYVAARAAKSLREAEENKTVDR